MHHKRSLFAAKLDAKRRRLGWTNEHLAVQLNVSPALTSRVQGGSRRVTLDFAQAVIRLWPEFTHYLSTDLLAEGEHGAGYAGADLA